MDTLEYRARGERGFKDGGGDGGPAAAASHDSVRGFWCCRRVWPSPSVVLTGVLECRSPPRVADREPFARREKRCPRTTRARQPMDREIGALLCRTPALGRFSLIVLVDDSAFVAQSRNNLNVGDVHAFEPAGRRARIGACPQQEDNWGCEGSLGSMPV